MVRSIGLALILIFATLQGATASGGTLAADTAWQKAQAGELVIIDIRSQGEWRATGIPKGSRTITIHDSEGLEGFYRKLVAAVGTDRGKAIAMICAAGGRSARASRYLAGKGFTNIIDIEEGMLGTWQHPGWIKRGLPVEPYNASGG